MSANVSAFEVDCVAGLANVAIGCGWYILILVHGPEPCGGSSTDILGACLPGSVYADVDWATYVPLDSVGGIVERFCGRIYDEFDRGSDDHAIV